MDDAPSYLKFALKMTHLLFEKTPTATNIGFSNEITYCQYFDTA